MKEFYKWRGIISSQESAIEEPFKYSLWPSEKSLVCLETFCLKNNPKGKKNLTTALISVCWVQPFSCFAFRPYFRAVV